MDLLGYPAGNGRQKGLEIMRIENKATGTVFVFEHIIIQLILR